MKKVFVFILMALCVASSMDAAGYRGNRRGGGRRSSYHSSYRGGGHRGGRGGGGGSYTHNIGVMLGNEFGLSYKGFVFGVDGLALETNLVMKLHGGRYKEDVSIKPSTDFPYALDIDTTGAGVNFTFEFNPNILYQKEVAPVGRGTFALYCGGGTSIGLTRELRVLGMRNPVMGKFGVNAVAGMEFIWSKFVLSFDFRPGYGLAFSNKYGMRDADTFGLLVDRIPAEHNYRHFFDYGITMGLRYCW